MNFEKQKAWDEDREFARNGYQKQFERDEIQWNRLKKSINFTKDFRLI